MAMVNNSQTIQALLTVPAMGGIDAAPTLRGIYA